MIKNMVIFCFAILLTTASFGQSNKDLDKSILVKYSKQELNEIKENNPEEYEYLKYTVKHAFFISDAPKEKIKATPEKFKEIELKSMKINNFYDLGVEILENKNQYFIIKGTDQLLMVKSKGTLLYELNK